MLFLNVIHISIFTDILGNAYVSLFFTCGQNPQLSQQALSAYAQSVSTSHLSSGHVYMLSKSICALIFHSYFLPSQEKVDRAACCYPELHFNRATLFQYEEMFGSALGGYSRAAALDPGWEEPPEREKQLLEYLEKVIELIQNKVLLQQLLILITLWHNHYQHLTYQVLYSFLFLFLIIADIEQHKTTAWNLWTVHACM